MSQRFTRQQRLLDAKAFSQVFSNQAVRSVDNSLTLIAAPNDMGSPRLGLAIAKKQLRKAVDRNRCKRIIRESFRQHSQQLPALDIVVLARSELLHTDNAQLHDKLARHWQRLAKRWQQAQADNPL